MYDLLERKKILEINERSIKERLERINIQMENLGATDYDKISVMGHSKGLTIDDLIDTKQVLQNDLKYIQDEMLILNKEIQQILKVLKEHKDRNALIYYYVKFEKLDPVNVAIKYNISERQVRRIIKEIESVKDEE